ncbi:aldose 1-epimerase [Muricauda sp. SCSIO 64092]|uniref:aldose epimerase family protein n=1 Tax=Allomuricauda sp. SCSIO 64092 TaxID=2908842 RepID=UPI001FF27B63|nr:aldose 1-epimerase [Muricauda sp. SCSIO 64092]UOY05271.1 aldose 1-epimerase [Muricauda sp. SCSIO 64092]
MTQLRLGNQIVQITDGELTGYKVGGHEFVHQKGSPGWGSADTEMFPIIGPVNEAGFQVQVPKGSAIQDQHGHLRQFPYDLLAVSETAAIFKKEYRAGTPIKNSKYPGKSTQEWLVWPYSFGFEKRFQLHEDALEITFTISGERDMPFMLGYHPAFKLHAKDPTIVTKEKTITLDEVLAVGSRALLVADHDELTLEDKKGVTIKTEGFGHFMCWTEVRNMVCIEPITFYPYAVEQLHLHEGFQYLKGNQVLKVWIKPKG